MIHNLLSIVPKRRYSQPGSNWQPSPRDGYNHRVKARTGETRKTSFGFWCRIPTRCKNAVSKQRCDISCTVLTSFSVKKTPQHSKSLNKGKKKAKGALLRPRCSHRVPLTDRLRLNLSETVEDSTSTKPRNRVGQETEGTFFGSTFLPFSTGTM